MIFPLPASVLPTQPSATQPTCYAIFKLFLKPLGSLLIIKEGLSGTAGHRTQQANQFLLRVRGNPTVAAPQPSSPARHQPQGQGEGAVPPGGRYSPTAGTAGTFRPLLWGAEPSLPPAARGEAALRTRRGYPGCGAAASAPTPGSRGAASPGRGPPSTGTGTTDPTAAG